MHIMSRIDVRNLQDGLCGGVIVAVIGLPMTLAFGIASGAGTVFKTMEGCFNQSFSAPFGGGPL